MEKNAFEVKSVDGVNAFKIRNRDYTKFSSVDI